jgi:hypothetical protein
MWKLHRTSWTGSVQLTASTKTERDLREDRDRSKFLASSETSVIEAR